MATAAKVPVGIGMGGRSLPSLRMARMKVFFQGALTGSWASGWQRCETLRGLVDEVIPFCHQTFLQQAAPTRWQRLMQRHHFNDAVVDAFNQEWLRAVLECRPNIAWLEWPKLL